MITYLGLHAQSLRLDKYEQSETGLVGSEIRTHLVLTNISTHPILVTMSTTKNDIRSSQKSSLCLNNECEDLLIARQPKEFKLMPGESSANLTAVLETGLVQGLSNITYRFSVSGSPGDYVETELHYSINERKVEGVLYSSRNIELSDVFPNPASTVAIFDYHISDASREAKIVIHSVLGSIAGEFELNPYESRLKFSVENYNPGVYFYTLYIEGEGVATKKMVVKK